MRGAGGRECTGKLTTEAVFGDGCLRRRLLYCNLYLHQGGGLHQITVLISVNKDLEMVGKDL